MFSYHLKRYNVDLVVLLAFKIIERGPLQTEMNYIAALTSSFFVRIKRKERPSKI